MIFNSKEYFVDVVTFDKENNENVYTVRSLDDARYFIETCLEDGRINRSEKCRIMLSENNFDNEVKEDAFWEGGKVDLYNLDKTMDVAAMQLPFDLIENSSYEYNTCMYDFDPYDCNCQLVLIYHYHGQNIRYSRRFNSLVSLNEFIRKNMNLLKPDRFEEGYNFSVEMRGNDSVISSEGQFVLSHIELEPNTVRPLTLDEITYMEFSALMIPYEPTDTENFEIEVDKNFYELTC